MRILAELVGSDGMADLAGKLDAAIVLSSQSNRTSRKLDYSELVELFENIQRSVQKLQSHSKNCSGYGLRCPEQCDCVYGELARLTKFRIATG